MLEEAYLGTPLSVAEGRVLYEIAKAPEGLTPKAISGVTGLDAGYLSRILKRFEREALTTRAPSPEDGRSITITLAAKGPRSSQGWTRRRTRWWKGSSRGWTTASAGG
uniref:MarR family transcriptional regulator n=1 Tax=Phenylobacterium glaciei TaxID=2803784 RepID=A0A974P4R5_9CAUL|nr:MarR family transcriptional regulator [Phenylobacterium glaciei]